MTSSPTPVDHATAPQAESDTPPRLEYWTPRRGRWTLPTALEPVAILLLFGIALRIGPALCRVLLLFVRLAH